MKKLTTKIMDNGKEKEIAVFLDDETARVLEECGDKELKHGYIVEEYKYQLIERRETRRHQSLEKSIEGGHEFVDHKADVEQNLEKKEEIEQLYKALKFLTKKQMYVLRLHVLEQKTFQEISEIMGINLYTVYEHYVTAKKKLTIYLNTAQYSVEHDEIEQYRISHRQSEECREAIDKAISENFDGMRLKDGFIPELVDKFGIFVVAMGAPLLINGLSAWVGA